MWVSWFLIFFGIIGILASTLWKKRDPLNITDTDDDEEYVDLDLQYYLATYRQRKDNYDEVDKIDSNDAGEVKKQSMNDNTNSWCFGKTQDNSISTLELTKVYGNFRTVDSLTIDIRSRDIVGFLGPNGAGKTTTIRMLCGLISPSNC